MNNTNFIQLGEGFTVGELRKISEKALSLAEVSEKTQGYTLFVRLSNAALDVADFIVNS